MNLHNLFNRHKHSSPPSQTSDQETTLKDHSIQDSTPAELREKIEEVKRELHDSSLNSVFSRKIGDHFGTMIDREQGRASIQLALELSQSLGGAILECLIGGIEETIGSRFLDDRFSKAMPHNIASELLHDEVWKAKKSLLSTADVVEAFPEIGSLIKDAIERVDFGRGRFNVAKWEDAVRKYLDETRNESLTGSKREYSKAVVTRLLKDQKDDRAAISAVGKELMQEVFVQVIEDLQKNLAHHILLSSTISTDPLTMAIDILAEEIAQRKSRLDKDDLKTMYPSLDLTIARGKKEVQHFLHQVNKELDHLKERTPKYSLNEYSEQIVSVLGDGGEDRIILAAKKDEIKIEIARSLVEDVKKTLEERIRKRETVETDPHGIAFEAVYDECYALKQNVKTAGKVHHLYPGLRSIIESGGASAELYVEQVAQALDEARSEKRTRLTRRYGEHVLGLLYAERKSVDRSVVEHVTFTGIIGDVKNTLTERLRAMKAIDSDPQSAACSLIIEEAYRSASSVKTVSAALQRHPELRKGLNR